LPELRQLKQRIGLRSRIPPLTPAQVHDYIRTRLRVAGAHDLALFTQQAVARIAEYSGGIPRVVNMLCDHCLLFSYADQVRRIDRGIVEEAIDYLNDGERPGRKARRGLGSWRMTPLRWTVLAASAAAAGLAILTVADPDVLRRTLEVG